MNLLAAVLLLLAPDSTGRLMPVPASVSWETGRWRMDSSFTVRVLGQPKDARLDRAVARFVRRAERTTGLSLNQGRSGFDIRVQGPGQAAQSPTENETYKLTVGRYGATLEAPTTVGALRGLETLLQLIDADSAGWFLPWVRIDDTPRFPWRGLLIDVSRHWQPPEAIKRQLDAMAVVKLNVFHWHLSEDQGFRVESKRFPRLQGMGSDGNYYTQEQIREIVAYARDRGIRVVPEFDVPGHSTAWFVGYPQYASGPGPFSIERRFGVFKPTFDPTREATYLFLDQFIGEMVTLFPDPYWHIGGDEVEGSQWRENPRIRAFMKLHKLADNDALQAYFNRRLSGILTRHGKRMVGWDEIQHPDLPKTTVVQSWRGQQSLTEGARQGYSGILSAGWYLDAMRTAEYHYLVDPLSGGALSPEESGRILGGEACMWAEHLSIESIDSRIWPRMAAIAERLWSPREVRDVADMYRRLDLMRPRLELAGLGSESYVARMARQLSNGQDPTPLRQLLELVEPARFGERASLQKLNQQVPLVFIPDAARPEPPSHWAYRSLAMELFSANPGTARVRFDSAFARWRRFPQEIERLSVDAPLVRDAIPAARGLARVAAIGAEALEAPAGAARAEWARGRLAELDTLFRLQGLLRISVIPAIKLLVQGSAP